MRQARHLRGKHPILVTHLNREDERPLIVHSSRATAIVGDIERSPVWDGRQLILPAPPSWDLLMQSGWTAGPDGVRGSGPGQKAAFENAVAHVVVLIAGSTGSALRAVRPPNLH